MNKKTLLISLLASGIGLISTMLFTNPLNGGFYITLLPLILIWLVVFSFISIIILAVKQVSSRSKTIFSVSIASSCVMLVMFAALGDVSIIDVLLLASLTVLLNFYLVRAWPK